ncbi:hypothetical protein KW783_02040, partial [Candidatus Parcubacteria bacterium]|nr:hypothetical protein [Candidatus Parcubacteria bacterium]
MNNTLYSYKNFLRNVFLLAAFLAVSLVSHDAHAETLGPNLVPNSGLETASGANPASWLRGGWGTNSAVFEYPSSGQTGNGAKVSISSYTSGDAKWYFSDVFVDSGAQYEFSDNYNSTVPTFVTVQFKNSSGALSWVDIANPGASSAWGTVSTRFNVPSGTVSATVFHLIKQIGSLSVDNVSLRKVTTDTPPPPPPDPTNLIRNPQLEAGDGSGNPTDWFRGRWGTNTAQFSYPVTGQSGNAAQVMVSSYSSG